MKTPIIESSGFMKQTTSNGLTFMTGLEGQGTRIMPTTSVIQMDNFEEELGHE